MCLTNKSTIDTTKSKNTQRAEEMIKNNEWHERWISAVSLLLIGVFPAVLFACRQQWWCPCGIDNDNYYPWKLIYIGWPIFVPLLFWFGYVAFAIWWPVGDERSEHMKHLQQLGLNVWVAIAAVFAVIWF